MTYNNDELLAMNISARVMSTRLISPWYKRCVFTSCSKFFHNLNFTKHFRGEEYNLSGMPWKCPLWTETKKANDKWYHVILGLIVDLKCQPLRRNPPPKLSHLLRWRRHIFPNKETNIFHCEEWENVKRHRLKQSNYSEMKYDNVILPFIDLIVFPFRKSSCSEVKRVALLSEVTLEEADPLFC